MKTSTTLTLIIIMLNLVFIAKAQELGTPEGGSNYFIWEGENTSSPLGNWKLMTPSELNYFEGTGTVPTVNNTYLEYLGANTYNSAGTPLEYSFTCGKTGDYRIGLRMHQDKAGGLEDDKANDVFVKMEGNFTSACIISTEDLKLNHKAFGRGAAWGKISNMEGHVDGVKKTPVIQYNLIEGESYTFTMSGRSKQACIDYIMIYDKSLGLNILNLLDMADVTDSRYRPEGAIEGEVSIIDAITSNTMPLEIPASGTIAFTVDFTTPEPRDLYVNLKNIDTQPYETIATKLIQIDSEGTANISVELPSLLTGTSYRWTAYLTERDGDFSTMVANTKKQVFAKLSVTSTDVNDAMVNNKISIYPNPVKSSFSVNGLKPGAYSVSIYNLNGTKVYCSQIHERDHIDISSLNKGSYILKLVSTKHSYTLKIIKN